MAMKPFKGSEDRPPRESGGRRTRYSFGSSKFGDDDGARLEPDGYPPEDWNTFANAQRPNPPHPFDAEEQAAGVVLNRPKKGY